VLQELRGDPEDNTEPEWQEPIRHQ